MSKPKKNKTWLYITGAVAAVGAGSVAAKIVTGHWWWKGSGSNDATQLVKIANDGKTVTLSSTESFFTRNGALEGITRIKSQVGKLIWDLEYIANEHVAKGDKVDVCIHGNLGVTYAGQLLNITDGYNQRVDVKYYFYEGSTAPDVPSYYDQFSKGVKMEKSAFDHLCDVGGRFGQYVAYETDDGKYFVSAIPLQTETQQIEKAVVIAYLFNGIPTSDADVLSNLKYKRYDPAHVGDINYSTGVHDVTAFSGSVQIAGGDSTVQKYKKVFGDGTHTTKTNGILTTQQNLIQQDKDAVVACSPDLCN